MAVHFYYTFCFFLACHAAEDTARDTLPGWGMQESLFNYVRRRTHGPRRRAVRSFSAFIRSFIVHHFEAPPRFLCALLIPPFFQKQNDFTIAFHCCVPTGDGGCEGSGNTQLGFRIYARWAIVRGSGRMALPPPPPSVENHGRRSTSVWCVCV